MHSTHGGAIPATARNPEVAQPLNAALITTTTLRGLISRFGADIVKSTLRSLLSADGKVRHDGPETSASAAKLTFASQRGKCLSAVYLAGTAGTTAAAVARSVNLSRNQAATRLGELHDWDLLEYRVDPDTGKQAVASVGPRTTGRLHFITPLGQQTLLALAQEDSDAQN